MPATSAPRPALPGAPVAPSAAMTTGAGGPLPVVEAPVNHDPAANAPGIENTTVAAPAKASSAKKARRQPEQQKPPVQRLRLRYNKLGTARFASHRDFTRAFERALRRAAVPMAYSSGFNPHPRISYANAAPTGAESEAEYLEIGLASVCEPERVRAALDAALPPGMGVVEVVEARGGGLPDRLTASAWEVRVVGADAAGLTAAVEALLGADEIEIGRMTKNGLRRFDARAAVVRAGVGRAGDEPVLRLLLRQGTPLVRPDDVVTAMKQVAPAATEGWGPVLLRRLAQGPLGEGVGDGAAASESDVTACLRDPLA